MRERVLRMDQRVSSLADVWGWGLVWGVARGVVVVDVTFAMEVPRS